MTSKANVPILPTIVVALAVLLMVRLGVWQLHRLHEKEALIVRYAANLHQAPTPYLALLPIGEDKLFRRTTAICGIVRSWKSESGRTARDIPGWRHIALCGTEAGGAGLAVDIGTSQTAAAPDWKGGAVSGRITWAPTGQPLIARLFGAEAAPTPMIIAESPAPGLAASAQPDPAAIPNNHFSYALQWFFFAATAVVIYGIALWRRVRPGS